MKWWNEDKLFNELARYFSKWGIKQWPDPEFNGSSAAFHRDNLRDILEKYKDA